MLPQWYNHLAKQDQDKFKESIIASDFILDRVRQILYNMIKDVERVKTTDYDSPSWSHKQAHQNGEIEMAKRIIQLLDISDKEGTK